MDSHTIVNNWLFDEVMPKTGMAAFKVVCAVVRKTWGWGKEWDMISLSQFSEITGIDGRTNVSKGIKEAIDRGFVIREPFANGFRYKPVASNDSLLDYVKNMVIVPEDSNESLPSSNETLLEETPASNESLPTIVKDIYTHTPAYEHPPLPAELAEQQELEELESAIGSVVKETYAPGVNEQLFRDAARALKALDTTAEKVKGFKDWWLKQGYYSGRPSLKSLVSEYKNYLEWDTLPKRNGNHAGAAKPDKQQLLADLRHAVNRTYGRRGYKRAMAEMDPAQKAIIAKMGKWEALGDMNEKQFEIAFYRALNEVSHAVS